MTKHNLEIRLTIFLMGVLLCLSNIALAEEMLPNSTWKCIDLLDTQTKSSLSSHEQFFASLFTFPNEYKKASETGRKRLVLQWVKQLRGNDYDKTAMAAAYLGMVKAKKAAKALENRVVTGGGGGRIRWICTRSLGQIGEKSSITVLISLLDNVNTDTRVYARVSLAEITGKYFGEDKEKWKSWQSGETPQLCTSTECKIDKASPKTSGTQRLFSSEKLDFSLPDTYGRIVDSRDYANVPVLIMSGSCWCGGCQQDAEPLRKIAAEYTDKGLATIRTVAGDNELAALDFQKHYRLPFVQLLDTNRSFEKRYNRDGWTFLMLADRNGKIVYKINSPHKKDWSELRGILNKMLSDPMPGKNIMRDGVMYTPVTLQRSGELKNQGICERFPSIACGDDGKIYVVFTTNRNGSNDIFIRVFDGKTWSQDLPFAATDSDEYDGTVVVDKEGKAWISWVSNAKGNNYDILISPLTRLGSSAPIQLTYSDDDAMHPRMACDEKGRIWVTYYKWHKRGTVSRDKEVYFRRLENGKWSQEIQVSPTDVPWYEDHTEPAISTYGSGAVIAWSWDFHPPNKGYSNQGQTPTIFMRAIASNLDMGDIARVSEKKIEVTPSLITTKDRQVWFAWDSLDGSRRKSLCVGNPDIGRDYPVDEIRSLDKPVMNVCSPCFAEGPNGQLTLLWSETENGRKWVLKRADLNAENNWSTETIKSSGDPRFCSAAYDSRANVWIAYSAVTKKGREIVVDNLRKSKPATSSKIAKNDATSGNAKAINKLQYAIDEKYSYRDLSGVDWDKTFSIYAPKLNRCRTPKQFAQITSKMLSRARDAHIWVKLDGKNIPGGYKRKIRSNYSVTLLSKIVPQWKKRNKIINSGRFDNDIGYILISSWSRHDKEMQKSAYQALRELSDTRALIIDVRPNGGGSETLAKEFAGCFIDKSAVYAKHVYRNANAAEGWTQIQKRILTPNKDRLKYRGKIAILMGQANMSSCEAFLLMMKQVPNCKLIGETSYGSSGNPKPYDLGNGVTVWLPSWKALRPDETCFEGQGIKPDITIRTNERQLRVEDPVLESAFRYLRSSL